MWEGALFAMQLCGLWLLIHWLMNDERLGAKGETGLLAVRRARTAPPPKQQGRRRSYR
jgi:hypothetical protein